MSTPITGEGLPDCPIVTLEGIRDNHTDAFLINLLDEIIRLRRRQTDLINANNRLIDQRRGVQQKFGLIVGLVKAHEKAVTVIAETD